MKLSKKKQDQNKELHKVYEQMDRDAIDGGMFYCSGCGRSDAPLHHSHILSRKQHPELITNPGNIVYDCASIGETKGCHDKWEDKNPEELNQLDNLSYRLRYIMEHDDKLFWDLIYKLNPEITEEL